MSPVPYPLVSADSDSTESFVTVNGVDHQPNGDSEHINGYSNGYTPASSDDGEPQSSYEPIAIIGCGMRLPGGVDSSEALWRLLDGKHEGRCEVPHDRYNIDAFYGPGKQGHVCTRYGYFLNDIDLAQADTSFWSMTRKEIEEMDPQQRLALEVVYECLQNSGTTKFKNKNIGCYFGIFGEDWADMRAKETLHAGMYRITGSGDFVVANRVSYEFGLQGPSMTIRTACSSSLTGLHEACIGIHRGECESAIVGGTNLILNPQMTIGMTEQGVLSPDGRCRTFDADANGYCRGEAVVAVHIKKLSDALRDNDPIRAVIRSSCINSDGRTAGLSLPSSDSHEALMRRSYALAGIKDPSKTAMIECHGTGTQVGDPLEAIAVARVFGNDGIYIGSIKPNLGHSEGASGVTSIIKTMLALENGRILPNINFSKPNPKIPFEECGLKVPTETLEWPENRAQRIGVNSFGIGGANAHILLDSPAEMGIHIPKEPTEITEKRYLLTFSASSADALRKVVQNHERYLEQKPESLADLSYTLNVRREPLAHRAFAVVEGQPKFEPFQVSQFTKSEEGREIAFVFTGQGAQWAQMGAELFESSAIFRNSIEKMEKTLRNCPNPPEWSLKRELLLPGKLSRISVAELSQPCCTAVQVALVDVLREWGIRPSSVVGHSSGEIAAAYASGAISAEEAILIAYYRGYVTTKITTNGKMAAIGLGREDVTPYLRPGVTIGCENSPGSTTLTGDADQLEVVMQSIKEAFPDTLVRALRVDCAYHSHHMQAVASAYASTLSSIRAKEPEVPFFSSVTGSKLSDTRLDGAYWVSNLVSPVLFLSAVSELVKESSPSKTLLEIGPHSALAGPVRQICKAVNATKVEHVGTLIRNQDANSALLTCAGNLFLRGHAIDFNAVTPKGRTLTDLPNYPWQREGHYWSESRLSQAWRQQKYPKHDILGARCAEASEFNPTWRNLLRLDDVPWIRDHNISEDTVFPGAGYVAMVGEAARQLTGSIDFTVREVNIMNALVLHEHQAHEVMTHLKPNKLTTSLDSAWYDFEISSRDGDRWTKHAIGQVRGGLKYAPPTANIAALGRKVGSEKWYSVMRRFGLNYGPRFQGLKAITADVLERKAVASLENTIEAGESVYAMHPSALDLVFQLYSVASSKGLSRLFNQLSVPTYIQELYIHPATEEITVQVETDTTPRGAFFGDAIGTVGGQTVLHLKNLRFSPLADASEARGADPHAAVELVWKPDIHFIDNASLMHVNKDVSGLSLLVERMALACMVESSAQLAGKTPHQSFLVKFQNWIDRMRDEALGGSYPNIHDCKWIAEMASKERRDLIETIYKQTTATEAYGISTAVYRIYHACVDLFAGKTDALEVLLQDDILTKVYDFGRVSDFREFFTLASHYKPNLKILEVGAGTGGTTSTILPYLSSEEGRHYFSYTYTDVSPGFFGSAKERFAKYEAVEYKVLDISKDPLEQGFEPNSFDLIVASNVIHATANLTETLANVRKLLTPEGRFFLQELSPPTKWINFVMGTLPGWWLGEAEGRVDEPYLAPSKWEPYLREAGFDGIEAIHHDNQFNATMIAVPAKPPVASRVTLLVLDPESAVVKEVADILTKKGYTLDIHKWGELPPANQDAVALLDLEQPFLHEMSEEQYMHFRSTTQHLKDAGILWVTGSAQVNCKDPRYGMILGTARTLRTELSLDLATFELDRFDTPALEAIATLLPEFQRRPKSFENKSALEWALSDGKIHIGRFHWISVNKQLASSASADTYAKRLDIEKRGFLNSLQWKPYKPAALEDDYVEIQNFAVGLNFKDVLISMGVVEGKILEGDGLGCESAGVVTKVGPKVKDLKPGDRCMVFASGAFSSSMTVREELCAKIPPTMSFAEAASMPTVYCTVIYSLCNVAHLEKGQSVLIHSACGGVGIAAIQICQSIGAEIYCTVGSEEKVQHLMNNYGIPKERIFNSRDLTFQRDLMTATNGHGADVVLNSLSGELLHASWQCTAEFGFMIEIGKRDMHGKGAIALDLFERNRSYVGVDFAQIGAQRPWIASRLLRKTVDMYERGEIKAITPITEFKGNDVEAAMRFMQKGSHIGKVVVTLPEDASELSVSQSAKRQFTLQPDASYLLIGGLGGLGQAIAIWMAEAGASEIVFLSPSAGDEQRYSSFVKELQCLGCRAVLVPGSVVDMSAVENAIRSATKPLKGVMQASMVLRDTAFPKMEYDDWQAAVAPKVQGTWNLHNALLAANVNVDFFLLFSSWSGLVGQWGQANYAAANSFLDAFAQYRHDLGLPAATVNIGAMEDIGYLSRNLHQLEHFRAASTHVLYEQDLLDTLELMMYRSRPEDAGSKSSRRAADSEFVSKGQIAIGLRSTQKLSAPNNRTVWKFDPRMAMYYNLEGQDNEVAASGNEQLKLFLGEATIQPAMLDTDDSAVFLATEIGKTLFSFTMKDVADLELDSSPAALGVDSLVSIELRNWFKHKLGVDVTVLEIQSSHSILDLGRHAATLLKSKFAGTEGPQNGEGNEKYLDMKAP